MDNITINASEDATGLEAAKCGAEAIVAAIAARGRARVIFASAPSQEAMVKWLSQDERIDWQRVHSFHMDEYIGLDANQPQAFGQWLLDRLPASAAEKFERIHTDSEVAAELSRYSAVLAQAPIDVSFVGVGVNGHIAFNEPGDTDFDDPRLVREIHLDTVSRQQQVDDGLFENIDLVPKVALTLTVPALMSADVVVCTVLGKQKAEAVSKSVTGPVSTECPASILQNHKQASWFLDTPAAAMLESSSDGDLA